MKLKKILFNRITLLIAVIVLEVLVLIGIIRHFEEYAAVVDGVLRFLSIFIVLNIMRTSDRISMDLMWIVIILLFPVFGTAFYLFLGAELLTSRTMWSIRDQSKKAEKYYQQDGETLKEAEEDCPHLAGQMNFLSKTDHYPVYRNTGFDYYPLGELGFPVMIRELEKAQEFIFLEYFIIEPGKMWDAILEVLEEKAANGVEVRVMYDDFGSLKTLPSNYSKKLEAKGIHCSRFNEINPVLNTIMNHRDHRKILVIDGKVGFTGGINLADEYINVKKRFGVWKDNCVRVQGKAVWSMTVMFLTNWNAIHRTNEDYTQWKRNPDEGQPDGWIIPYANNPLDDRMTAQRVYMNILNQAKSYVWIFTPYLLIDTDMITALTGAAERGVDVRIIMPGIPDKKMIRSIGRSYYKQLIRRGVRIYEYTPGFDHAKVFVSDDEVATVGTINLDYRSLYLHFENGIWLCHSDKIKDIRDDLANAFEKSHEYTLKESTYGFFRTIFISIVRLFAPMM